MLSFLNNFFYNIYFELEIIQNRKINVKYLIYIILLEIYKNFSFFI